MRCPTCGVDNAPEAEYCSNCGVPIAGQRGEGQSVLYCPSCGSENSPDATLCVRCGADTGGPPTHGAGSRGSAHYGSTIPVAGDLMPRDLGQLLSETFRVYGANFRTFFLIALVAQVPVLVGSLLTSSPLFYIFVIVGVVLSILAHAAAVSAVVGGYLGRATGVGECYRRAWARVVSLVGGFVAYIIGLALSAAAIVLIIGLPVFFYLLVSWVFYPQVIILEGKGPLEGLGRSRALVRGTWWRVFGIGIIFVVVLLIIELIVSIPGSLVSATSPIAGAILLAIAGSIVAPIGYIGATLVYLDLRVRKEGYTLEAMASEAAIEA